MRTAIIAVFVGLVVAGCTITADDSIRSDQKSGATTSAVPSTAAIDVRLVGNWQGQRDPAGACPFLSWEMVRTADGKFEITFYSDPSRTKQDAIERGIWWTDGSELYVQAHGEPTPDVYTYAFSDKDTLRYVARKMAPSSDCQGSYKFSERRVANADKSMSTAPSTPY